LEDIFFCFRLLLGRSPGEKEWPGHSSFQGEKLETVVKAYLGSLEFANRRLLSKESISGIQVAKCGDFLIYCDPNDLAVAKYVLSNAYEPHVTQLFRDRLSPGMGVLDIGANIGYYSMLFAQLVGPEGYVLAIEPNPSNCKLLEASRRLNGFENLTLVQAAAGRELGLLAFHESFSNGFTSDLRDDLQSIVESHTVACVRPDILVPADRPIHAIKIDVEGAEFNALMGSQSIIEKYHPLIVSEFCPPALENISRADWQNYLMFFVDRGYSLWVIEAYGDLLPCGKEIDKVYRAYRDNSGDHIDILAVWP